MLPFFIARQLFGELWRVAAQVTSGPPLSSRLVACAQPACPFLHVDGRHRHCCAVCAQTGSGAHSKRCLKLQRTLVRAGLTPPYGFRQCQTPSCSRVSSNGFRSCCSMCRGSDGLQHSRRCQSTVHPWNAGTTNGPHSIATASTAASTAEADVRDDDDASSLSLSSLSSLCIGSRSSAEVPSAALSSASPAVAHAAGDSLDHGREMHPTTALAFSAASLDRMD